MDMFNTEMMFTIGLLNTFFYVQHAVYVVYVLLVSARRPFTHFVAQEIDKKIEDMCAFKQPLSLSFQKRSGFYGDSIPPFNTKFGMDIKA